MRFGEPFLGTEKNFFARLGRHYYGNPFLGSFIRFNHFMLATSGLHFESALDAGCGKGEYCFFLASKNPLLEVQGFDINKKQIEESSALAKKHGFRKVKFFFADLIKPGITRKYDLVFSIDSLEHAKNNKEALEKLCWLTAPGGLLFVHMPAKNSEVGFFPERFFKKYAAFEKEQHVGKNYSMEEFAKLVESNGFKILKKAKTFGFFGEFAWELDRLCQERNLRLFRALLLPFTKAIGYLDIMIDNKKGNSFFVLARKAKK